MVTCLQNLPVGYTKSLVALSTLPCLPRSFGRALGWPHVESGGTLLAAGTADPGRCAEGGRLELFACSRVLKKGGREERHAAIVCVRERGGRGGWGSKGAAKNVYFKTLGGRISVSCRTRQAAGCCQTRQGRRGRVLDADCKRLLFARAARGPCHGCVQGAPTTMLRMESSSWASILSSLPRASFTWHGT